MNAKFCKQNNKTDVAIQHMYKIYIFENMTSDKLSLTIRANLTFAPPPHLNFNV